MTNSKFCGILILENERGTEMEKRYNVEYTTYVNQKKVYSVTTESLIDVSEAVSQIIHINWENLQEIYYKYGFVLPFNYWNFKKGYRRISFFNASLFDKNTWDIKERKKKIDITLEIVYKEIEKT